MARRRIRPSVPHGAIFYFRHIYVADIESVKCDICGREEAEWICIVCDGKMVCTDCDKKWHQHPRRHSHKREQLKSEQPKFVNGISSSLPSSGCFTRTSAASKLIEDLPVLEDTTVGKTLIRDEDTAGIVGGASNVPTLPAGNESLMTGELSALRQTDVRLLPKSVAEINEDLSLRSLTDVNNSLVPERNSAGLTAHQNHTPDSVQRSNSRQLNSLTSDFETTLNNLQSMMKEVSNSMMAGNGQSGSGDTDVENWNFTATANKETELPRSPSFSGLSSNHSNTASTTSESVADKKQHAIEDELAKLVAEAKYPPHVGTSRVPKPPSVELMKPVVSEQAPVFVKVQNTGQPVNSKSSPVCDVTTDIKDRHTVDSRDPVRRTANISPAGYDLPSTGIQTVFHEHKDALTETLNSSAQSGHHQIQPTINRQKSQTFVKQRLEDSPGVVYPRVGDGKDLGVSERSGSDYAPAYHSKFTDIHDEVL